MIISVEEVKELIDTKNWTDKKIEMKLKAIESAIRSYTNNNFQNRAVRLECPVMNQQLYGGVTGLVVGDTVQLSESQFNNGLYVVESISDDYIKLSEDLLDESHCLVTKIVYPEDVVDVAVNLLEWEINNRSKVGIQSETLSRHSVTYFNMDGDNSTQGYPKSLMGALKPYRKARC